MGTVTIAHSHFAEALALPTSLEEQYRAHVDMITRDFINDRQQNLFLNYIELTLNKITCSNSIFNLIIMSRMIVSYSIGYLMQPINNQNVLLFIL